VSARTAWLAVRSAVLWAASAAHFFGVGTLLVALGAAIPPRRFDPWVRLFMRNQVRLAGARLTVIRSPGFDPRRTSVFVCNHVSIFDPFVLYSAIPQFVRGLELESHFRVPVYGWMMRNFGNVPVPVVRTPASLRAMRERCRHALASGTSLLVFPEGHRTRDGRVGRFHLGAFRMARELGVPVVPVSQVGAWDLKRVGSWWLSPARIIVHLHAPIETTGLGREDDAALCERARAAVAGPVS
jgi:1-acyl-sn-glycerol-3-phosphate acyltransferase